MSGAGEDAGSVLPGIPRPFDVLTVASPVSRGAEPFCAELAIVDSCHFDTVLAVMDVLTVRVILFIHVQGGIPELGAAEVCRGLTVVAIQAMTKANQG